jgi:hypothetical protein
VVPDGLFKNVVLLISISLKAFPVVSSSDPATEVDSGGELVADSVEVVE